MKAAALAALALAAPSQGPDEMCSQVNAFHMARFDNAVKPEGRRWVEVHWIGGWMDFNRGWGFQCQHSPDAASSRLCAWIIHHTSYEFPFLAPQRILTCYGYRFPQGAQWGSWKSDIGMLDHDRWLKLEIDFVRIANDDEEGAIRLSSFAKDQDDALVELPPLAPLAKK